MKSLITAAMLAVLTLDFLPAAAVTQDVTIDPSRYGAIAYSPKTGKYGYAWNQSDRIAAERIALSECKADDAKLLTWVQNGWATLVIAEDKAYGYAEVHGQSAGSRDSYERAERNLREKSSAKLKTIITICSGDVKPWVSVARDAQNPPPDKDEKPPVVGAKIGDDPNAPTTYMRLEYQLRILAYFHPGRMTVDRVFPGGPATKLLSLPDRKPGYLEPGDVITHVDGRRINSQADYYLAMYLSGPRRNGKVKLTVIDVNTRNTVEFEARAERVGGGRARVKPLGDAQRATKVKVLLIAATADKTLKDGASENLKILTQYVTGLPKFDEKTDLVVLKGTDLRAVKIMRAIESLDVEPTETLFCYIACHGAHDESIAEGDPSGGHFFSVDDGHLTRRSLFTALTDRGAQLTVLITDTCNAQGRYVPPSVTGLPPGGIESKVLTELLYGYEGVIDVSGTSKGEYGWYGNRGGLFTMSMIGTLKRMEEKPAGIDWKKFLATTAADASATFQAEKKATLDKEKADPKMDPDTRKKLEAQADQRPQGFQMVVKPVKK